MLRFARQIPLVALLAMGLCLPGCSKMDNSAPTLENPALENSEQPVAAEPTEKAPLSPNPEEPRPLPPPPGATAMPKPHRVWVDKKQKTVIVDGYVSLREGMLEMFACPAGTKEHESIVAVHSRAQIVHAALLASGAKTGRPVSWRPEFSPPTGTEIAIEVQWLDDAGEWQKISAREWVMNMKTNQPMQTNWVFAGSSFWQHEETGEQFYEAESGDFICVSNFSTATLDIPTESSQINDGLMFEANTEKIPPLGTPVRLVLKPKLEKEVAEVERKAGGK